MESEDRSECSCSTVANTWGFLWNKMKSVFIDTFTQVTREQGVHKSSWLYYKGNYWVLKHAMLCPARAVSANRSHPQCRCNSSVVIVVVNSLELISWSSLFWLKANFWQLLDEVFPGGVCDIQNNQGRSYRDLDYTFWISQNRILVVTLNEKIVTTVNIYFQTWNHTKLNPVALPDLYFHWSLWPVASFVIRARGIVWVLLPNVEPYKARELDIVNVLDIAIV